MLKFELEMISMCSFLAKIKLLHHMRNYWSLVLLLYILRKIISSKSQAGQWNIQKCIPMDSLACVLLKKKKKTGKIKSIISSAFSLYMVVLDTMWAPALSPPFLPTVFAKFSGGKSPKYTGIQLGQIWCLLCCTG